MNSIRIGACLSAASLCLTALSCKERVSDKSRPQVVETLFTLSAVVDGSDRFVFTEHAIRHVHMYARQPQGAMFGGQPWTDLRETPSSWTSEAKGLDLSKARLANRRGRDLIALEHTDEGFDLYFADTPSGEASYEVTIAIPRR